MREIPYRIVPDAFRRGYRFYCNKCHVYQTIYLEESSPSSGLTPEAHATLAELHQVFADHIKTFHGDEIQNGANFGDIGVAPL